MMLDHLDDPIPYIPDGDLRARVDARSRQLRRRHRLLRTLSVIGLVGLIAAGGSLYVARRDAAIDRIDVSTQPSSDGATNILVVGPDPARDHADSISIVRIEPNGAVRLLAIPRDLWDEQGQIRINSSYAEGVQSLIDSVHRVTGVPIDHYIEMDFEGFVALVDEIGGLPVAIDRPIRDEPTGLQLDGAECVTLGGETLLALVRARHLEYLDDTGTWRADPTADLGRIARAQSLATIALGTLASADTDPAALDRYSRILADHAALDRGLSLRRLVELGQALASAGPTGTTADRLPVEQATNADGANVLHLAVGATDVLDRYGSEELPNTAGASTATEFEPAVPFTSC
jgi:LCP family protein required for cell wall assembly